MNTNFDRCLALLLKHEGGFVNHPSDPGGMTNLGVTARVWEEWVGLDWRRPIIVITIPIAIARMNY